MFPTSIEGSIPIQPLDDLALETLKRAIEEDLKHQGIKYEVVGTNIAFKGWPFAIWSLSRYAVVGHGRFALRTDRIEYSLSTRALVILATSIAALAALIVLPNANLSLTTRCAIIGGIWLYFFGTNYMLIWIRNRRFLRKLTSTAR